MAINRNTILKATRRIAVLSLFAVTAISAFAVLGDGRSDKPRTYNRSLLSGQKYNPNKFSLKSGYTYKGNLVISPNANTQPYINLNTTVTYQKGNTTYIVPLKKKIYVSVSNSTITLTH